VPTADPPGAPDPVFTHLPQLPDRGKEPNSAAVLERWVSAAQQAAGAEAGRLGWLVASTVVIATRQPAVDDEHPVALPAQGRHQITLEEEVRCHSHPLKFVKSVKSVGGGTCRITRIYEVVDKWLR
jgi:hypothetical protein